MLVCAGRNETLCYATPIGVGLVEASLGLARILFGGGVENIIFLGSAGAYSKEVLLFDMFCSIEATQIESSFLDGGSYTPIDNVIKIEEVDFDLFGLSSLWTDKHSDKNVSYETLANSINFKERVKHAVVNSSNYITTDENKAKQMARAGILLENMEFYAVMKVAQSFGVPAMGIFCVTNYCDKNAHKDFLSNHNVAKQKLENFIESHNVWYKTK